MDERDCSVQSENYDNVNLRNIYERKTDKRALFLCIDALDFKKPRLKLRFCNHDDTKERGKRITDEVDIYIPIGTFLVLTNDLVNGVLSRKKKNAMLAGCKDASYFESYGGEYKPTVISRQLRVVDGMGAASFALVATAGPGEVKENGRIIPKAGSTPTQSIFINMPDDEFKEMALIGKAYIEQYIGLSLQESLSVIRAQRNRWKEQKASDGLQ